jgi:hypothetical protein
MNNQTNKPKGTFSKLMSSSTIQVDHDGGSVIPESLKSGKPENRDSGNRGNGETRNPEFR